MSALCQKRTFCAAAETGVYSMTSCGNVQCLIGWRVRQLERIGNGTTNDLAIVHIETITQMQVIVERLPPSLVGERKDKRCRCIGQSERRSARHGTWHISHAIMHDVVDHKRRMRMCSR